MRYAFVIVFLGIWLIIDGIYSIIKYRKQTWQEHLIRVIRAGGGAALIILYQA